MPLERRNPRSHGPDAFRSARERLYVARTLLQVAADDWARAGRSRYRKAYITIFGLGLRR